MSLSFRRIHFIGIAGIGMSALAKLCHHYGVAIQGSNSDAFPESMACLEAQGIRLFVGHERGRLPADTDCVVVSSAIKKDNPEMQEAHERGIPVVHRSILLQELLRPYKVIAVTGTHGKTTTTSLLGYMLEQAGLSPLIISGGIMAAYKSNLKIGTGQWAVVEADESDKSHLNFLSLWGAIVTNVEAEHMDSYSSFSELVETFSHMLSKTTYSRVVCGDDRELAYLASLLPNVTTYGLNPSCTLRAQNVRFGPSQMSFDVVQGPLFWPSAQLNLLGKHNVLNALSVVATARTLKIPEAIIARALSTFPGVERRLTYLGKEKGITFVDDYAHHPTEIKAVLETLRQIVPGRLIAVCQPHRYSRLKECMTLFQHCFTHADQVILLPVYAAGESPLPGVTSAYLHGLLPSSLLCEGRTEDLCSLLHDICKEGDTVVFLGAGDITYMARHMLHYFHHVQCA